MIKNQFSTGIPGLDRVFRGLLPGDNLVWQIDDIADFIPFVPGYCRSAHQAGRPLVYFRFADHPPLVTDADGARIAPLETGAGFEHFITEVRSLIRAAGRGAFFLFDSLSAVADIWASDRMLGNFFMLSCPFVYDMESIAYFPLLRGQHSHHATDPIGRTTQVMTEVYRHRGVLYLQPMKVEQRYSPNMYRLHAWQGEHFTPIAESATIADILSARPWAGLEAERFRSGTWNRVLLDAERIHAQEQRAGETTEDGRQAFEALLNMLFSRDPQVVALARQHLGLKDLLAIARRMIGTGLIGGKSVGMLLARAILRQSDARWNTRLEPHDSFFIGSDIYYTFLVDNGCWLNRQRPRLTPEAADDLHEARRRMITGRFPDDLMREFADMLDYFSQSPIIVRSSSLLEDSYGNAFAGKYESVFCANQGSHRKRLDDLLAAIKTIYAGTLSEKALRYRQHRGLLERDEQMSLLVQRVSGSRHGNLFLPQVAGVGLSRNPFVWHPRIDPQAGMVRLVFGLGTRAVDRSDDDYTRIVALNAPRRRPESNTQEVRQYSQRRVDVIDLDASQVLTEEFSALAPHLEDALPLALFATPDREHQRPNGAAPLLLTFDRLLSKTPFVDDLREMLRTLEAAYAYPVDVEFTANFPPDGDYQINLVQCRPLQVTAETSVTEQPAQIPAERHLLASHGSVIGASRQQRLDQVLWVCPEVYARLPIQDRYAVARLIGRVLRREAASDERNTLLIGPGRWGTTTPTLGVPVNFSEIDTIAVLCEIVAMRDGLIPDVSLGTHFFNDLVESNILYLALFPGRDGHLLNTEWLASAPNQLTELAPDAAAWSDAVRLIDPARAGLRLSLWANVLEQKVLCFFEAEEPASYENPETPDRRERECKPIPGRSCVLINDN